MIRVSRKSQNITKQRAAFIKLRSARWRKRRPLEYAEQMRQLAVIKMLWIANASFDNGTE